MRTLVEIYKDLVEASKDYIAVSKVINMTPMVNDLPYGSEKVLEYMKKNVHLLLKEMADFLPCQDEP